MPRSFRFDPPEPGPASLVRPRLLHALLARWHHRAVTLVGGPGLGKTTLVAQALAENRLAERGEDVWLGLEPDDAEGDALARAVATALSRLSPGRDGEVASANVADAVWRRSPTEVCLVFDDVHLLGEGSDGARWLAQLIDSLPENGHVVLTSRSEPGVPLARLRSQAQVLDLGEEDLRFSGEELATLADRRGLDRRQLDETGGWPALAELAAKLGGRHAGEYLWEEVLAPLGEERCGVLAVLCELGGADGDLAAAALDAPVDLAAAVEDVPLVAHDADGWYVPHHLWREASGLTLTRAQRGEIRRRAARHLIGRGRFDEAFTLLAEGDLWDAVPEVLRAACVASERLAVVQMERWLLAIPPEVRASAEGRLLTGMHAAFARPREAVEPLQDAAARCRARGDLDAEVTAIAELIKLAWWRHDTAGLADLGARVFELDGTGHPTVRALAAFGRALWADVVGDDRAVLAELDSIEPTALDASWRVHVDYMRAIVHQETGDLDLAIDLVQRSLPHTAPVNRYVLDSVRLVSLWKQGRIDEVLAEAPAAIAAARRAGVRYNLYLGLAMTSTLYAHAGDPVAARACFEESLAYAPPLTDGHLTVQLALAMAAIELAEGDEAAATAALRDAFTTHGLHQPGDRRAWINAMALSYVLVPETRQHWDAAPLRGHHAGARDLARLLVAGRTGADPQTFASCQLPDLSMMRATLHHRLAAELAVQLHAAGRPEGPALLDALGPVGRTTARALAENRTHLRKPARALLATLPAPPPRPAYVAALGQLTLSSDGWDGCGNVHPYFRRKKVQTLLGYLITQRRTTRPAMAAALWPDLDEPAANNNLAVTLSYLLKVLEPWRPAGEPSYLLQLEGQSVKLAVGEHLRIDLDDFDRHLRLAQEAEADGIPSVALDHHLAAVALYRGKLFADLPETGWMALDREHYCTRFVATATRAGELLLGRGEIDEAESVARRAIDVDPWAEDAHGVLVAAALASGDRSVAKRRLDRCFRSLAEIDVKPSEGTRRLQRRVVGHSNDSAPD